MCVPSKLSIEFITKVEWKILSRIYCIRDSGKNGALRKAAQNNSIVNPTISSLRVGKLPDALHYTNLKRGAYIITTYIALNELVIRSHLQLLG